MEPQRGRWLRLGIRVSWVVAILVTIAVCWSTYFAYGNGALPKTAIWILIATIGGSAAWFLISTIVLIVSGVSSVMSE